MNWIGSLTFVAALVVGHSYAQTPAKAGNESATPAAKETAVSRVGDAVRVSVSGPRPLEQALDELRLHYGWRVSYEDPQYLTAKDLTDAVAGKGPRLPSGGAFRVEFPTEESPADTPPADRSLKIVVDSYNQSGNPGQFELRKIDDGIFSVVGVAARDEKGKISAQKALLDSTISVSAKERTIDDTLELICKKLAEAMHLPVSLGITPRNLVEHISAKAGGANEPARTILFRALAATGHTMYWRLLYDPDSKGYVLNIHSLRAPKDVGRETPGKPPSADAHPSKPK